jgi:predicted esterase
MPSYLAMSAGSQEVSAEPTTLNVLALHGSEGNAEEFPSRSLAALKDLFLTKRHVELKITSIEAPFPKGNGFAWWKLDPGVRSYTADEYQGFETSVSQVLGTWALSNSDQKFDLVIGHSQGAILIASLLALEKSPYHPSLGYILNGVAFPNPFKRQVESLSFAEEEITRCLFLMGEQDKINPIRSAEKLKKALDEAGLNVVTISHPRGHGFPQDDDSTQQIIDWIVEGL